MAWTKEQDLKLISLSKENKYFYSEIAEKLNMLPSRVRNRAKILGLSSTKEIIRSRGGEWNRKHSHLKEKVMTYFLNHSNEETMKKFNLTKSEIKSLFTCGYRDQKLKHLRKDKRIKTPWTTDQIKTLLQYSGLRPRKYVARIIGRGNQVCIKEKLQSFGLSTRTLQGINYSQYIRSFNKKPSIYFQTDCGPRALKGETLWKIVPWVQLQKEVKLKKINPPEVLKQFISARAMFQEWIFEGNALNKMKKIIGEINDK